MTSKEIVEDLLQRIPEGASLHDIAREIEFIAAVRLGLDELDLRYPPSQAFNLPR